MEKLNWKQALFIGCAQVLALIPGTSRSGITITAGLFSKFNKESVVEFSFLMSVPIIALAGADGFLNIFSQGFVESGAGNLVAGFLSALLSGLLAIWGLLKLIKKYSFTSFVVYRVILGILILLFLL